MGVTAHGASACHVYWDSLSAHKMLALTGHLPKTVEARSLNARRSGSVLPDCMSNADISLILASRARSVPWFKTGPT